MLDTSVLNEVLKDHAPSKEMTEAQDAFEKALQVVVGSLPDKSSAQSSESEKEPFRRAVALVNIYLDADGSERKTPTRSVDGKTLEDMVTGPAGIARRMADGDSGRFTTLPKFDMVFGGTTAYGERLFNRIGVKAEALTEADYVRAGKYLDYGKLWELIADAMKAEEANRVKKLGGIPDKTWDAIGMVDGYKKLMEEIGSPEGLEDQDQILQAARKQFPTLSEAELEVFASQVARGTKAFVKEIKK